MEELPESLHPLEKINAIAIPDQPYLSGVTDPAKILAYFCFCHESRVYPPTWIMNELYNRFHEYLTDNGTGKNKRRLGEYFGEPARGDRSAFFRQEAFRPVMELSFIAVDRLRCCFGLTKEAALSIVAARLELVINKTSHRFKKGEAALEKAYREWCKGEHYQEWLERSIKNRTFLAEETKDFLRSFPPDSFTGYPHIESLMKN